MKKKWTQQISCEILWFTSERLSTLAVSHWVTLCHGRSSLLKLSVGVFDRKPMQVSFPKGSAHVAHPNCSNLF